MGQYAQTIKAKVFSECPNVYQVSSSPRQNVSVQKLSGPTEFVISKGTVSSDDSKTIQQREANLRNQSVSPLNLS